MCTDYKVEVIIRYIKIKFENGSEEFFTGLLTGYFNKSKKTSKTGPFAKIGMIRLLIARVLFQVWICSQSLVRYGEYKVFRSIAWFVLPYVKINTKTDQVCSPEAFPI